MVHSSLAQLRANPVDRVHRSVCELDTCGAIGSGWLVSRRHGPRAPRAVRLRIAQQRNGIGVRCEGAREARAWLSDAAIACGAAAHAINYPRPSCQRHISLNPSRRQIHTLDSESKVGRHVPY